MKKFGMAFRRARLYSDLTFREIAAHTGKSIGYLSEIESGKKNAPDLELVKKLEDVLGVTDGHLQLLAEEERFQLPSNINSLVRKDPKLSRLLTSCEIFFREDPNSENGDALAKEFEKVIEFIEKVREEMSTNGIESAKKLYGNRFNVMFSGMGV
ncbi:MAG: helix-turn-helix domain-containing protein [Acidobacteria bacterium]|nr:helix-turn-helix domain-containing protein [Acidobacteriota bacterium]